MPSRFRVCVNAVHNLGMALVRSSTCGPIDVAYVGVGVPLPQVTLTLAHPKQSPSVNDSDAVVCCVQLEDTCEEVVLLHPPRKWVVPLCWGVVKRY